MDSNSESDVETDAGVDGDDDLWRALADPTRRRLLDLLGVSPSTTGTLAANFTISRIAVMRHLEVLADAGLVLSRKRGRERWHFVNVTPLLALRNRWGGVESVALAESLLTLKDQVENVHEEEAVTAEITSIDIELEIAMNASPGSIYRAITETPAAWWGPPFIGGDATSLTLDPVLGGSLIEGWPGGGMILATVTGVTCDRWIQLAGPFHLGVASAVVAITIDPDGDGSTVSLSCRAHGLIDSATRSAFSGAWHELVAVRLKAFVEDGMAMGIGVTDTE